MSRLVCIGECMVELAEAPDAGAGLWRMGFAGDTFNTAWHARRELPREWSVGYLSAVGDDPVSDAMLGFMADAGIETGAVRRIADAAPGLYMIHLDGAERSFSYWRDGSAARRLAEDGDHLAPALEAADCVYVSGITLAILPPEDRARLLGALRARREAGAMVAFDSNLRPRLWPGTPEMLAAIDEAAAVVTVALPTGPDEAAARGWNGSEAVAAHYLALGVSEVVVKAGADPALVATSDGVETVAAEPVARPVDTTGAGDSFNGAWLAARLSGASALDATRAAHRTAARVIQARGALA